MSAFIEMCADLSAKNCIVKYAEENGIDVTEKIKFQNIPTNAGLTNFNENFSSYHNKKESCGLNFSFSKPTVDIKESHSLWLNGEPSWKTLQKMRIENEDRKGC
jgi:hypothetical protein